MLCKKSKHVEIDLWRLAKSLVLPYFETDLYLVTLVPSFEGARRNRDIKRLIEICDEAFDLILCHELSAESAFAVLQCRALFSKNSSLGSPDDSVAIAGLLADERRNAQTNEKFKSQDFTSAQKGLLRRVAFAIEECLGDFDDFIEEIPSRIRFTNGATETEPRSRAQSHRKVRKIVRGPWTMAPLIGALSTWFSISLKHDVSNTNRVTVVPKNFKTGRTIACEPRGSLPLQLACEAVVKKRLRDVGQNLSDQKRNAKLAREGSISGAYATIDLKSASNSLTTGLLSAIREFGSENLSRHINLWFMLRSPQGILPDGSVHEYSMFSSMGNGLTFALETLVFWSIARALGCETISIYGDDCIIETQKAAHYVEALSFIGFETNEEKTFIKGPFRESCGGNYFRGIDITPVYIRGRLCGPLLCHVLNLFENRLHLLSSDALELIANVRDANHDLPRVTRALPTWAGIYVDNDVALSEGLIFQEKDCPGRYVIKAYSLFEVGKRNRVCGVGGYIQWLFRSANNDRPTADESVEAIRLMETMSRSVVKWKVRKTPALIGLNTLCTEIGDLGYRHL